MVASWSLGDPEVSWGSGHFISRESGIQDVEGLSARRLKEILSGMDSPDPAFLLRLLKDRRKNLRKLALDFFRRGGDISSNEDIFRRGKVKFLAGVDEAGRGALAGPLVAAAVVFSPGTAIEGIADSKELSPERREELYSRIMEKALCVSVSFVDPRLIDRFGIQVMNRRALAEAAAALSELCDVVICDHFELPGLPMPSYGIPSADVTFQSVAAASIVAKVERDRVMMALHEKFPHYGFRANKGYATARHLEALSIYGPCHFHRFSYRGVYPEAMDRSLWEG